MCPKRGTGFRCLSRTAVWLHVLAAKGCSRTANTTWEPGSRERKREDCGTLMKVKSGSNLAGPCLRKARDDHRSEDDRGEVWSDTLREETKWLPGSINIFRTICLKTEVVPALAMTTDFWIAFQWSFTPWRPHKSFQVTAALDCKEARFPEVEQPAGCHFGFVWNHKTYEKYSNVKCPLCVPECGVGQ